MIEKIKRHLKEYSMPHSTTGKLICSMAEYLIEQHEQKEARTQFIPKSKAEELKQCEDYFKKAYEPVVEVGQIWRNKNDSFLCEIISTRSYGVRIRFYNGHEDGKSKEDLFDDYERVTMQNIKHGEWVEHVFYKFKQRVLSNDNGKIMLVVTGELNGTINNNNFKPTLPPIAEEEKEDTDKEYDRIKTAWDKSIAEEKLYTQEDLDKELKQAGANFLEAHNILLDKLQQANETILSYKENLDRTAIQEFNKGKAVGYEEGYKNGYDQGQYGGVIDAIDKLKEYREKIRA